MQLQVPRKILMGGGEPTRQWTCSHYPNPRLLLALPVLADWAICISHILHSTDRHAQAGPTNVHPRILAAQALPMVGYFQPPLLEIMDEIQTGLRQALLAEPSIYLAAGFRMQLADCTALALGILHCNGRHLSRVRVRRAVP